MRNDGVIQRSDEKSSLSVRSVFNNSLDASDERAFLNLVGAADGAFDRDAASAQPYAHYFKALKLSMRWALSFVRIGE